MSGEAAGFEQVARRIEVHLGAELEVLLGAARNQRGEMEYDVDVGRYQRAGELRISDVADEGGGCRLIGADDFMRCQSLDQRGTDVARSAGHEYSHGDKHSKEGGEHVSRITGVGFVVFRSIRMVAGLPLETREDHRALRRRRLGRRLWAL